MLDGKELAGGRVYATPGLVLGFNGFRELLRTCAREEHGTGRAMSDYDHLATAGQRHA